MSKLVVIGDKSSLGGIYLFTKNIEEINRKDTDISFFSTKTKEKFLREKNSLISALYYDKWYYKILLFFDIIKILSNTRKIDKFLILSEHNSPIGYFFKKLKKIEYFMFIHGNYSTYLPKKFKIYHQSFLNAKIIISISEFTKDIFIKKITNKKKIIVVYPGISKNIFFKEKKVTKEKEIIFNGDISKKRKGFSFLLKYIEENTFKYKLSIISNHNTKNEYANEIVNKLNKLNIKFKIYRNINSNKLREIYNRSDFNFACADPNYLNKEYEGFNITILEASACGIPSVGSKNTGNECAIKNGLGYLVRFNDLKELSNILNYQGKLDSNIDADKIRTWNSCWDEITNLIN